jgi:hypothetical protein
MQENNYNSKGQRVLNYKNKIIKLKIKSLFLKEILISLI